jgi:hypothetical protein
MLGLNGGKSHTKPIASMLWERSMNTDKRPWVEKIEQHTARNPAALEVYAIKVRRYDLWSSIGYIMRGI